MFTVADRNNLCDFMLHQASSDGRVVAGALVGALALDNGDRWSDLDLNFAVADEFSIFAVLTDWTDVIVKAYDAAHLFDLQRGPSIYRVFLLPSCLQFDLSLTPKSQFGPIGPKFKLLFGNIVDKPFSPPPSAMELFGYAVHHALRARFCIERGKYWQAEYWISSTRDYALHLGCLRRGLPSDHGRGFDNLPMDLLAAFEDSFVSTLTRDALLRALESVIDGLLIETEDVQRLAVKVESQLRKLTTLY